ncbi:hypothetical protein BUALT_Bualt18G0084600 [Buddleja alternifolia]|uniref:Uncharacterized protein n=1 Tax=Buddleja alternifolia TaxID=168488 RepID=A0AAV6W474_9LAMI|nr:hypothetical protein BUALT_Bualt18G0084600 [Buddleja alternifolia]
MGLRHRQPVVAGLHRQTFTLSLFGSNLTHRSCPISKSLRLLSHFAPPICLTQLLMGGCGLDACFMALSSVESIAALFYLLDYFRYLVLVLFSA